MILDGTPCSCRGQGCSFSFEGDATPTIESINPLEGQGGTNITIYGVGFSYNMSTITVTVGNAPCTLVSTNSTQITCTLSNHAAGYYDVSVLIEGKGVSVSTNSTCFHYLLTVDSVTPSSGGVGGGSPIDIYGNGFLEFTPLPPNDLDMPLSFLPWFRRGLGVPTANSPDDLRVCPMFREMLSELMDRFEAESVNKIVDRVGEFTMREGMDMTEQLFPFDCEDENCTSPVNCEDKNCTSNFTIVEDGHFVFSYLIVHLLNLYHHLPSSVYLNGVPCVIVNSTVQKITCIPTPSLPANVNITVQVFSETASLAPSSYQVTLEDTPFISSLDPPQGAVTGGNRLTIVGSKFGASMNSDVTVIIGGSVCAVQSANNTHVVCVTGASRPSRYPVFVTTPNGLAVLESAFMDMGSGLGPLSGSGSGMEQEMMLFPTFEYRLVIYLSDSVASVGSVFGGRRVEIEGGVFAPNYTRVLVGGQEVELEVVTMDTIEFLTPSSTTTHVVKLKRSDFRGTLGHSTHYNCNCSNCTMLGDSTHYKYSNCTMLGDSTHYNYTTSNCTYAL